MIKSITIEEGFETSTHWYLGSQRIGGGRTIGYKLPTLPVGAVLSTNRPLVILIGPNGSGKTTLLEKLAAQTSERGKEYKARYFGLQHNGYDPSIYLVGRTSQIEQENLSNKMQMDVLDKSSRIFEEEKKEAGVNLIPSSTAALMMFDIRKTCFEEENKEIRYVQNASTGQYQELYLLQEIEKAKEKPAGTVLCLDEPTLGLDMINTKKIIQEIKNYALERPGRQVFVATHNPDFCKLPSAQIISLYEKTATSYDSESLNIENYLESLT